MEPLPLGCNWPYCFRLDAGRSFVLRRLSLMVIIDARNENVAFVMVVCGVFRSCARL